MNRRQMLTVATGIAFSGFVPLSGRAQNNSPWIISDEELKTDIVLPKERSNRVETNRLDGSLSRYEKLIKSAESVYPFNLTTDATGKPIWYLKGEPERSYNITPRAINYYFNSAANYKDGESGSKYTVEVNELEVVTDKKTEEDVIVVSLLLEYFYACGNLCGYGFTAKKIVVFNQKQEIASLYMPKFIGYVS